MNHGRNKKKILLITVICILAAFFIIILPALTVVIYNDNFNVRFETAEWLKYSVSDFEGLKMTECTFTSNNRQRLAGYKYSKDGQPVKGVAVLAHGFGGGGHNTYMDVADYFTSNGYLVFAYDATGNDKSEGDAVGGLPQGVIDLDYALRYVKQAEEYKDLPIVLFGHSWGGYSVGNVLNRHPDVKAAVIAAGFDRSDDLIQQQGESMVGAGIHLLMPYVSLYELLKFGEYSGYSAVDGFAKTEAGIMVLHSMNDTTVLPKYGYDKFFDKYNGDPRFIFRKYEDREHGYLYYSEAALRYSEQLDSDYTAYLEANGIKGNWDTYGEYMGKNMDKSRCYEFDDELMKEIVEFYDSYCE